MRQARDNVKRAAWVFVLAVLCACGGRKADAEPIPECKEAERLLGACDGRTYSLPIAAPPVGKSPEEREQMRKVCLFNVDRLKKACR